MSAGDIADVNIDPIFKASQETIERFEDATEALRRACPRDGQRISKWNDNTHALINSIRAIFQRGLRKTVTQYMISSKISFVPFVREITPQGTLMRLGMICKRSRLLQEDSHKEAIWIILTLNEGSLMDYFQSFKSNPKLIKRFYSKGGGSLFFNKEHIERLIFIAEELSHLNFDLNITKYEEFIKKGTLSSISSDDGAGVYDQEEPIEAQIEETGFDDNNNIQSENEGAQLKDRRKSSIVNYLSSLFAAGDPNDNNEGASVAEIPEMLPEQAEEIREATFQVQEALLNHLCDEDNQESVALPSISDDEADLVQQARGQAQEDFHSWTKRKSSTGSFLTSLFAFNNEKNQANANDRSPISGARNSPQPSYKSSRDGNAEDTFADEASTELADIIRKSSSLHQRPVVTLTPLTEGDGYDAENEAEAPASVEQPSLSSAFGKFWLKSIWEPASQIASRLGGVAARLASLASIESETEEEREGDFAHTILGLPKYRMTPVLTFENPDDFCYEMRICPEIEHSPEELAVCHDCGKDLGDLYMLCDVSGYHFCDACFGSEMIASPARIVADWDFQPRPVAISVKAQLEVHKGLTKIKIKGDWINPKLQTVAEMRKRLVLAVRCIVHCPTTTIIDLQSMLQHENHLLCTIDLYTLKDLENIRDDKLQAPLANALGFAIKHIEEECEDCQAASGKRCFGCGSKELIYDHQVDNVTVCPYCLYPTHRECMATYGCVNCRRLLISLNSPSVEQTALL